MNRWSEYIQAYEIAEIFRDMPPEAWEYIAEGLRKWAAQATPEDCRRVAGDLQKAAEVLQERSQ